MRNHLWHNTTQTKPAIPLKIEKIAITQQPSKYPQNSKKPPESEATASELKRATKPLKP
jgi:hypothetical protein